MTDMPGYEGVYGVTEDGKIWSHRKKRWLKSHIVNKKYLVVCMVIDGIHKHPPIHRIVAATYLPNDGTMTQVNHINGIKTDNRVANLEWSNNSLNQKHAHATGLQPSVKGSSNPFAKLNEHKVREIRREAASGVTTSDLMSKYKISRTQANAIIRRTVWQHVTEEITP